MSSDREKVEAVAGYIADLKEQCRRDKEACRAYLDFMVRLLAADEWSQASMCAEKLHARVNGIESFERTRKAYEKMIGDEIAAAEEATV